MRKCKTGLFNADVANDLFLTDREGCSILWIAAYKSAKSEGY